MHVYAAGTGLMEALRTIRRNRKCNFDIYTNAAHVTDTRSHLIGLKLDTAINTSGPEACISIVLL